MWIWILLRVSGKLNGTRDTSLAPLNSDSRVTFLVLERLNCYVSSSSRESITKLWLLQASSRHGGKSNWPWWNYLYHKNPQILQIRAFQRAVCKYLQTYKHTTTMYTMGKRLQPWSHMPRPHIGTVGEAGGLPEKLLIENRPGPGQRVRCKPVLSTSRCSILCWVLQG